jgi:carbonic anhydrase/acetyltransferase-like protein (isoleucine patch superfamily)
LLHDDAAIHEGITIQAGGHVIHADDLDEKTLALAKQLDAIATEHKEPRRPR